MINKKMMLSYIDNHDRQWFVIPANMRIHLETSELTGKFVNE